MKGHHFLRRLCAVVTGLMLIVNSSFAYADNNPYNDRDYETIVVVGVTDSGTFGDNLEWKLYSNGEFEITTTKSGTGIIPDFLKQADIPWRDYQSEIKSAKILDGVTRIGGAAFSYCENLSKVTISDDVSEIGESAFFKCNSLQSIIIPKSVQSIGRYCFWSCSELSYILFMNPECIIYDDATTICKDILISTGAFFDGVIAVNDLNLDNSVGKYAEKYGYKAKTISTIPNGQCGDNAFWNFDDATGTLTISGEGDMWDYNSYEDVPWQYLNMSMQLKDIIIKDGITAIGSNSFQYFLLQSDIVIPASVKRIGEDAFVCNIDRIYILNPNCDIYDSEYTISSGGNGTGSYYTGVLCGYKGSTAQAYAEKYGLAFLMLESPPTTTAVTTSSSVTTTTATTTITTAGKCGDNAFWNFDDATGTLTISGEGYMWDYDYVYKHPEWFPLKDNIKEVVIENGITGIGKEAFYSCSNIIDITIPESVLSIGSLAFKSCANLENIFVSKNNTKYTDIDGVLFIKSCSVLIRYPAGKKASEYNIPDGVVTIYDDSFNFCHNLENITMPDSVTSIGSDVFFGCANLKNISMSDNLRTIGSSAFCSCKNLTDLTFPKSVTEIDKNAFMYCYSLISINIPENIKYIGQRAFHGCEALKNITINNPECEIYSNGYGEDTISDTATMYGYTNSTAQAYAEKYNRTFIALDAPEETTASSAPITITTSTTIQSTITLTTSTTTTVTMTTAPLTSTSNTTAMTTTPVTTNREFMHAADAWSFGNVEKNFIDINTNEYVLLPEHRKKLEDILAWKDEYRLEKTLGNAKDTKGACYGMSVLTMLNYCGVISTSDIQEGTNFISDITLTDEVKSIVNYHHLLQCSEIIFNELKEFHYYNNNSERIEKLLEKAEQNPTIIFLRNDYTKPDGTPFNFQHVILAYKCSSGMYQKDGKIYDKKLSIYDPRKEEYSEDYNMFINSSTGNWTIPSSLSYDSSSTKPEKRAVIAGAINDTDILSANSLFTDKKNIAVSHLYRPDMLVSTSADGNIERIKQNGSLFGDGEDEDDIIEGFLFANGDSENEFIKSYYMRYSDASYQFSFNDDKYDYARLDMRYEHTLTDIEVNYLNKAVFSPESVKIKAMKSNYTLHNIHDIQQSENEFYKLDIQGKNASELELSYENGYWILSSDDPLGMLLITGTNTYGKTEKVFSTSAEKIKIYVENELSVVIMTDNDNDGIFETHLNYSITKGDINGNGTIDATDASEILMEYSRLSTGNNRTFSDEQFEIADIDCDGTVGSADASLILSFFSYLSTGGTETDMIKWELNC